MLSKIGTTGNGNTNSVKEETELKNNSSNVLKYSYNPQVTSDMTKEEGAKRTTGWIFKQIDWNETNLTKMVRTQSYIPSELKDGYKVKNNVLAVHNIILDFDKGSIPFRDFIKEAKGFRFSCVVHTTVNHQKLKIDSNTGEEIVGSAVDKFRVIIPLNEPITEHEYESCQTYWQNKYLDIDTTSFQGNRYYKVNPAAEVYFHNSYLDSDGNIVYTKFLNPRTAGMITKVKKKNGTNNTFSSDLMIKMKSGQEVRISEITSKSQVFCPFCDPAKRQHPNNDNAFVDFNDSGERYLYCSSEDKTYREKDSADIIQVKCDKFWSYGTSIYEAGIVSDVFSLENISEKKFYVKVGAESKEIKQEYFDYLVTKKHLHRLNRIDNIGDITVPESTYEFDKISGNITVKIKALPVKIQDNKFIENYLETVFGQHKDFIKQWLAVYTYTNYKKLPTVILTGDRGVGKNTFGEIVMAIYPALSETASDLQNNFTPFAEKKLLLIDESDSNGKVQYQMLKKFSGQKFLDVNKKFLPQYQVRNNLNILLLSNNDLPIYVERDEKPTNSRNNQFFVYRLMPHADFDAMYQDKIIERLGYYIHTELRSVFEKLNLDGYRYSIDVPITPDEQKLFNNSVTDIEAEADRLIDYLESHINDPSWDNYKFTKAGILPTSFFENLILNQRVNKVKVIQNLQKRGYITNDPAQRFQQIDGKRPYSYKLGEKVSVRECLDRHFGSQTDTFQMNFPKAS